MAEKQKLQALMKVPGNNKCIDCDAPYPQWASANVGVFMCLECSGVHRGLGVQVSFVRSCTMDKWTPEQVKRMAFGGNARATEFFRTEGSTEYRPNMPIKEKYNSHFAEDYREKLAAECEGLPWVKTARKPKMASATMAGGANISRTASPASFSSHGNGGSFGSRPPVSEAQKAQNEGFFASMGSKNAARSTDVPPSQGGKYVGFGSAPMEQPQERTGRAALDGLAAAGTNDDPLAILSRGWGFFSKTVTSTAKTVQEQYLQPGLERIQDPKFSEEARKYVDGFGQKVQEDAKYAYNSASRFVEGQQGAGGGGAPASAKSAGYEKVATGGGQRQQQQQQQDKHQAPTEAEGRSSWDGDNW